MVKLTPMGLQFIRNTANVMCHIIRSYRHPNSNLPFSTSDKLSLEMQVLIQLGDVLDRGEDEIAVLSLLRSLDIQARAQGGAVFQVCNVKNGNSFGH